MSAPRPDRAYPVEPLRGDDDPRFTFGLVFDIGEVLERHDYPRLGAMDHVELQQALFRFLYGDREARS